MAAAAMRSITLFGRTASYPAGLVGILIPEVVPEKAYGLGVDLADARFGYAQDVADLGQREPLEVIQGDDDLLSFGQRVDGLGQHLPGFVSLQAVGRIAGGQVGQRVQE